MRVPDYLNAWWTELGVNTVTANATHVAWRIRGPEGASRFRAAVRSAIARHDLLTTAVVRRADGFFLEEAQRWEFIERTAADVSSARGDDFSARLYWTVFDVVWTPFAPDAVVFRPFVIELSATDAVCGFVLHHRVVDYYGVQVLAREIRERILGTTSEAAGGQPPGRQADFLRGMADWIAGGEAEKRLEFWREYLRDAPPSCLPDALNLDTAAIGRVHYIHFELSAALRTRLVAAARSCRSTLSVLTMAAHHLALAAESGQSDVTATVLVSGRDTPALLNLVGYPADCFPLRAMIDPKAVFAAFARQMQQKFAQASRHRVKWEPVQAVMREVGASPIAPVFNFAAAADSAVAWKSTDGCEPSLDMELFEVDRSLELGSACFNMSHALTVFDKGQVVGAHVKYLELRHQTKTIESFIGRYSRCLTAIAENPFARVERIMDSSSVDPAEVRRLCFG